MYYYYYLYMSYYLFIIITNHEEVIIDLNVSKRVVSEYNNFINGKQQNKNIFTRVLRPKKVKK